MEKQLLEQFIQNGISANKIAKQTSKSLTTVRYWLKKYNLVTNFISFKDPNYIFTPLEEKKCPCCKLILSVDKFHNRRSGIGTSPYCKTCTTQQTMKRQREFKFKCLEYKGGKCEFCDYSKCVSALEFHHVNPDEKDFSISHIKALKFDHVVKEELDKCILLCVNCHREEHERLYSLKAIVIGEG